MGFDDRVHAGDLVLEVLSSDPPDPSVGELRGFESQIIQYVESSSGEPLAECHRYIVTRGPRAGDLGGSGRPDPKWLFVGDEEWNVAHGDDQTCGDCVSWRPLALGLR